ncbi:hypothetical protein QF037_009946 [Streptomyces canus]|nr:hypothetical protein [Streptomyces canus]
MTAHTDIQPEQTGTLSGSAAEGFTRLYGIPVTELVL